MPYKCLSKCLSQIERSQQETKDEEGQTLFNHKVVSDTSESNSSAIY